MYLRNFSISNNDQIYCYDKTTMKSFKTNISNIACGRHFYKMETNDKHDFENYFTNIERNCIPIFHSLIENRELDVLSLLDREHVSKYIAAQFIRTRESRERSKDMVKQLEQWLSDTTIPNHMQKEIDELKVNNFKEFHLYKIQDRIDKYSKIFMKKEWIIFVNMTLKVFLTSDNPIVRENVIYPNQTGKMGLGSEGIMIYFPLNPFICLGMTDVTVNPFSKSIYEMYFDGEVKRLNSLQVFESTMHIFSNLNSFQLAGTILTENPDYCNIDRKRLKTV